MCRIAPARKLLNARRLHFQRDGYSVEVVQTFAACFSLRRNLLMPSRPSSAMSAATLNCQTKKGADPRSTR